MVTTNRSPVDAVKSFKHTCGLLIYIEKDRRECAKFIAFTYVSEALEIHDNNS